MTKALIDTNVVLDALAARDPFRKDAEQIFLLAAEEAFQGYITANSLTDIYYLVRKNTTEAVAREAIRNLLHLFAVVDTSGKDCEKALDSPIKDYEDALITECAKKAGVDLIVTRDKAFLQAADEASTISPAAFLKTLSA